MNQKREKSGSAFLVVLVVMMGSLSLVAALQQVLVRRNTNLRIAQTDRQLRNALLLGLEAGVLLLSEDDDLTVDSASDLWAQPREYMTNTGVTLTIQLEDAQSRFNLNHLSLPVSPNSPRTFLDIFEDLVFSQDQPVDARVFQQLQTFILEQDLWFDDPQGLRNFPYPRTTEWAESPYLNALPRPENRPLLMNINTVKPEVLQAMVGSSLKPWTDSVIERRETEPIRTVAATLSTLPAIFHPLLLDTLDVRTDYVTAKITGEIDYTQKTLTALLHRLPDGEVEVVRCQW